MENGFSFKTLAPSADPMGAAIAEYFKTGKAAKLRVMSEMFDEDEIPVKTLFRTYAQMSKLEKLALEKAQGSILDVGAGSGCHSLALQDMGKEVCAIDISPLSVETMKARGVKDVAEVNLFSPMLDRKFDTILMLMNGTGIIGRLENMPLCREIMQRHAESYEEHWARRLVWTYQKLKKERGTIPFYWSDIREISGVRKRNIDKIIPLIQNYADADTTKIILNMTGA